MTLRLLAQIIRARHSVVTIRRNLTCATVIAAGLTVIAYVLVRTYTRRVSLPSMP